MASSIKTGTPWWYYLKLPFKRWAYELIDQLVIHFITPGNAGGILIFRLDLLGDYLVCRPFFKSLTASGQYQNKPLYFAGNQMLLELAPVLDNGVMKEFIWIDRPRFINSIAYRFRKLAEIRRRGFEVVINPSHTRQYWLESVIRVSGAKKKITSQPVGRYMNSREQLLSDSWYTQILPTFTGPQFEFYRNRDFFSQLAPSAEFISGLKEAGLTSSFEKKDVILISPGASTPERRWPEEKFARLLDQLSLDFPAYSHGLIGSEAESELSRRIADQCKISKPEIYAGKFNLPDSMHLIAASRLLISNESGPVHMAATTGTACVCISNGNHFGRWNPYPEELAYNILTCYPEEFYPLEKHKSELLHKYHDRSDLPAASVSFDCVRNACAILLERENDPKKQ